MLGGFAAWKQNFHRIPDEQSPLKFFIPALLVPAIKSRLDLGYHGQRNPDFLAFPPVFGKRPITTKQIGQPVRMRNPQPQPWPVF